MRHAATIATAADAAAIGFICRDAAAIRYCLMFYGCRRLLRRCYAITPPCCRRFSDIFHYAAIRLFIVDVFDADSLFSPPLLIFSLRHCRRHIDAAVLTLVIAAAFDIDYIITPFFMPRERHTMPLPLSICFRRAVSLHLMTRFLRASATLFAIFYYALRLFRDS
jgi:hypothetical protein